MTKDDLISRQAAIEAIYHHFPSVTREYATDVLHLVPSALTKREKGKRKEGKWLLKQERVDDYGSQRMLLRCSECGSAAYEYHQPFCHKCGAKMGG